MGTVQLVLPQDDARPGVQPALACETVRAAENADVSPMLFVAVAVRKWPTSTGIATTRVKLARPWASVVTVNEARKRSPSPKSGLSSNRIDAERVTLGVFC
jgi:hypothetical protein